jgi:aspartyl-tRNA(Asn)/glutamyl-tRNA(Gln) amidotransferase subunit B
MNDAPFEIIIGLEVHVQLQTQTKLFCRCSTRFGAAPNTQTCPVCLGLPGYLPVMNRRAFELALTTAVALHCQIPLFTKWDRKQYYYPDLPKGYQISQYDLPMSKDGYLEIEDPKGDFPTKRVGIIRAHLEEDAGKSMHDEAAGKADSRIDLNRTGTPLLEIVSQPDLRSPQEAKTFLQELKLLLTYLTVSDCNMQEGSLRVDANVNLHVAAGGAVVPTPIVEVKNMNSFRAVERALTYEAQRQYQVWQETGVARGQPGGHKTTRGWDEQAQVTRAQRHKEESSDYRYLPDPDLVPVVLTEAQIDAVRRSLGELPAELRRRIESVYGISPYDAEVLVSQGRALLEYFEALALAAGDGKQAANWVQQDVMRVLNERSQAVTEFPVRPSALAELLRAVRDAALDNSRAREVLQEMIHSRSSADQAMRTLGITAVDSSETIRLCRELLDANPKIVSDLKSGNTKAVGALVGQARRRNPNVNPVQVQQVFLKLVEEM